MSKIITYAKNIVLIMILSFDVKFGLNTYFCVISGMTEAYTTIACSLTRESTMATDGIIMTSNLDIIGLCTESILVVMVEGDMVSLSACPLLNRVLVMVTNTSRACSSSYFLSL